jgi:hypothetical protein
MSGEYKSMSENMEQNGFDNVKCLMNVIRIICGTLIVIQTKRGGI